MRQGVRVVQNLDLDISHILVYNNKAVTNSNSSTQASSKLQIVGHAMSTALHRHSSPLAHAARTAAGSCAITIAVGAIQIFRYHADKTLSLLICLTGLAVLIGVVGVMLARVFVYNAPNRGVGVGLTALVCLLGVVVFEPHGISLYLATIGPFLLVLGILTDLSIGLRHLRQPAPADRAERTTH
jgi:hypothetical protein